MPARAGLALMGGNLGARGRAALWAGKATAALSRGLRQGGGTTLPGDVARFVDPRILTRLARGLPDGSIVVTGTNGKTTTAALLRHIFEAGGQQPVANQAGANLIFGVTAAVINRTGWRGSNPATLGLFEIDEASLPRLVNEVSPRAIVVTNLFRDQLDRYGELETTAGHIRRALMQGPEGTTAVLNSDDPMVAALGDDLPRVVYAGLDDASLLRPELSHGADAKFCPRCGSPFIFEGVYFGHVGRYRCPRGDFARPVPEVRATSVRISGMERMQLQVTDGKESVAVEVPLSGLYNAYNVVMAMAGARAMGVSLTKSGAALHDFTPAFGRMEKAVVSGRDAILLLAKNPTGFNEVLRTSIEFGHARSFLIALNDRIADGQDVSWIWDVDFEQLKEAAAHIVVSGDRALDLRVRLKYAEVPAERIEVVPGWAAALARAADATPLGETLFVLPTYTAMLELRAVLTHDGALKPYWQASRTEAKPEGANRAG
ncbi:MAG: MurT ligase domain-containing protein [Candidatus Dormibacteraeota bacterium]|nr:MurT ligase domain-containing protein [Candidatus Dormibacteraeota bacterium]